MYLTLRMRLEATIYRDDVSKGTFITIMRWPL